MSIQELLLHPDSEILYSGAMVIQVVREWAKITGQQPSVCDCQLKNYLRTVRQFYKIYAA